MLILWGMTLEEQQLDTHRRRGLIMNHPDIYVYVHVYIERFIMNHQSIHPSCPENI